jgi:hypothetical protein
MRTFILLFALLHGTAGHGINISVPGPEEGNVASGYPFGFYPPFTMRYQQIYGASAFSELTEAGGWITAMAFRWEAGSGGGGYIPNVQINLSTTLRAVDALSTVFAENIGVDDTAVLGPGGAPFAGLPPTYEVAMTFSNAFFYDPSKGNLLLDVRLNEAASPGHQTHDLDAELTFGDPVSRVYAIGVDSPSGTADTLGLVTTFTVTPVPEPSPVLVLLLGLPAVLFAVYRIHNHNTQTKGKTWR